MARVHITSKRYSYTDRIAVLMDAALVMVLGLSLVRGRKSEKADIQRTEWCQIVRVRQRMVTDLEAQGTPEKFFRKFVSWGEDRCRKSIFWYECVECSGSASSSMTVATAGLSRAHKLACSFNQDYSSFGVDLLLQFVDDIGNSLPRMVRDDLALYCWCVLLFLCLAALNTLRLLSFQVGEGTLASTG